MVRESGVGVMWRKREGGQRSGPRVLTSLQGQERGCICVKDNQNARARQAAAENLGDLGSALHWNSGRRLLSGSL